MESDVEAALCKHSSVINKTTRYFNFILVLGTA
jgi:hypothetical protein